MKNVIGRMNPMVKKLWIKALETSRLPNGKRIYQGNGRLCKINTAGKRELHCCLGVLEEIHAIAHPDNVRIEKIDDQKIFNNNSNILSEATRKWTGLDSNDPTLFFAKQNIKCLASGANDGDPYTSTRDGRAKAIKKQSFKKIAEAIRISW